MRGPNFHCHASSRAVGEPQLRHGIAIRSAGSVWTTRGLPIHTMGAPASVGKVVDSVGLVLLRCGVSGMAQHSLGGVLFLDIHQVFSDLRKCLYAIEAIFSHGRLHKFLVRFVVGTEQLVIRDKLRGRICICVVLSD